MMVESIHRRILCAEDDLLSAMMSDSSAVDEFCRVWSALLEDIEKAMQSGSLDEETISLAHATSSRIGIMAETFLDFEDKSKTMGSLLQCELEEVFASVNITESQTSWKSLPIQPSVFRDDPYPSTSCPSSRTHSSCTPPGTSYIQSSYTWLLQNLHNPYPSKEARDSISKATGSPRKDIDGWFIDARKRMGWNALRKARFDNKRMDIVDAAMRFFVQEDPKRPLDPNVELEFASIETRARDLYSEKFSESDLAARLDVVVKDMTPQMKVQAKLNERPRKRARTRTSPNQAAALYPTPLHSPDHSPKASPLSSDGENDSYDITTSPSNSLKRRTSELEQPNKRSRLDHSADNVAIFGLPSPAASVHESIEATQNFVSATLSSSPDHATDVVSVSTMTNRKRRLSDADHRISKRPKNLPSGPRLHSVSDPLPMSKSLTETSPFDGWFQTNFDLTCAIGADSLDSSIPLDIQLYDYSSFVAPESIKSTSSHSTNYPLPAISEPIITSTAAHVDDFVSLHRADVVCSNKPFEWVVPDRIVCPSEKNSTPNKNTSYMVSAEPPFVPDLLEQLLEMPVQFHGLDPTNAAEPSALLSSESDLDWFNPLCQDSSTANIAASFSYDHAPFTFSEADLHAYHSQLQAEKVAKQLRLWEMKEETRKLEAELAAS